MEDKTKVLVNGEWRSAIRIPVRKSQEAWSEYILDDGSLVRLKSVVTEVYRIEDMYDNDGNPVYQIKSTNVASSVPAEDLKKKP